jgi:glutaredoxin 3
MTFSKIKKYYNFVENIMAAKVEIYIWTTCPFCARAKGLLKNKGVDFIEYNIDGDEMARNKMAQRTNGKRSLPQIFINDAHIGGCDDIHTLESQGKLDQMLAS